MKTEMLSEEVISDLYAYSKNPRGFLLFSGGVGRGKSYAAMQIYHRVSPFRLPAYDHDIAWFITQAELNLLFLEAHESTRNSADLLKKTTACKLLVLDDLGTRTPSAAYLDFLYAAVDRRYNERQEKGTIVTTNLDANRIRCEFGEAMLSRIASGRIYKFEGEDRRLTEKGLQSI